MTVRNQDQQSETKVKDAENEVQPAPTTKKEFVEPEISQPVDVLEATTFFQAVDSGSTN